jgi:hypothetical protein
MILRKGILASLSCYLVFIFARCSKTETKSQPPSVILNAFTYTVTDTMVRNYTVADTATFNTDSNKYYINGNDGFPVTAISPPDASNNQFLNFYFDDYLSSGRYQVHFSLPFFQGSWSGTNSVLNPPIELELGRVSYELIQPLSYPVPDFVYLSSCSFSTTISDSTGGFVSGNFQISATTVNSGTILISGKFSHAPSNYK